MTKLNQTIPYHTILYHIKPYYNIPYQTNHTIPTYNTTTYNTTRNKTMMTMVSRNNNGFMRLCVGHVTKKYPKRQQPNNIISAYLHQKSEDHRYYLHICIASYVITTLVPNGKEKRCKKCKEKMFFTAPVLSLIHI